jgi:hypothetical protein
MGRGLSKLQIRILQLAYRKRQEHTAPEEIARRKEERKRLIYMAAYGGIDLRKELGDEPPKPFDLPYTEIYGELFDFKPIYGDPQIAGKHFDPHPIKNYNSVLASVSRSVKRLWLRGLIDWYPATPRSHGAFLNINDKGIEYLKAIGYAGGEVTNSITDSKEIAVHNFSKDGMGAAISSKEEVMKNGRK